MNTINIRLDSVSKTFDLGKMGITSKPFTFGDITKNDTFKAELKSMVKLRLKEFQFSKKKEEDRDSNKKTIINSTLTVGEPEISFSIKWCLMEDFKGDTEVGLLENINNTLCHDGRITGNLRDISEQIFHNAKIKYQENLIDIEIKPRDIYKDYSNMFSDSIQELFRDTGNGEKGDLMLALQTMVTQIEQGKFNKASTLLTNRSAAREGATGSKSSSEEFNQEPSILPLGIRVFGYDLVGEGVKRLVFILDLLSEKGYLIGVTNKLSLIQLPSLKDQITEFLIVSHPIVSVEGIAMVEEDFIEFSIGGDGIPERSIRKG